MDLREMSLLLENETGFDSIPTIERVYDKTGASFICCFPRCNFSTKSSSAMWQHIHFEPAHSNAFEQTFKELKKHFGVKTRK